MERNKVAAGIILLLLFGILQVPATAQQLVFEKQVDSLPDHENFGPNRRHFYHPFFSTSITLPGSDGSTIRTDQILNGSINLGFRYKIKLARPVAMIAECGINSNHFSISQNDGKIFPDTLSHLSQSIRSKGLFGGFFLRIRTGQSGDYLGKYVDLGIKVQADIHNRLITKDDVYSTGHLPYVIDKTTTTAMRVNQPLNYWVSGRIGFDRLSLIASYRLSRIIEESLVQDLPALEIGMEISLVRY